MKQKNKEKVPSLEVFEVVLVQCKLVDNQYLPKKSEFIWHKTDDAVTKSNDTNIEKQEPDEEIITPSEKRDAILNKLRKAL